MPVAFYDYEEIKAVANCLEIARELGLPVTKDGRCPATWRGGNNKTAVSINERGWHDFVTEEKGSVIDLVAQVRCNGLLHEAQAWLGERLGLKPKSFARPSPAHSGRYDELLADGYFEAKRYDYTDAAGTLVHQAVRLEHAAKPKQFLQCDASGRWTVKHVEPVLYNLPNITDSPWAIVVEGEKDADTLIAMGLPATTNAGGAKKWQDSFSDALAGKNIVLMPDNDDAGRAHLALVGKSLLGKAKEIRTLTVSKLPKGDVTDWVEKEGGTKEALVDALKTAQLWVEPREDEMALAEAKEANQKPLRNYTLRKVETPSGKVKHEKEPRTLEAIIEDIHLRFLNFPRKIGEQLFDHDRDSTRIEYLNSTPDVFSWMALKSHGRTDWTRGDAFVTKEELVAGLRATAKRYEAISQVPDWPRRDDVYYAHPPLPDPTDGHSAFEGLIDFFAPASPEYRILLKALMCAPLFYRVGIPRPMWVIDSEDGAGTGKTTIAETVANLYGAPPLMCRKQNLTRGIDELVKRMVSSTGRDARVFMLDNITGAFHSEELAALVTQEVISGKAPYGKGEESRPNNLTYIMTANSATLDNDLAVRSFFLFVSRAKLSSAWKSRLQDYVRTHRLAIFADIMDILTRSDVPETLSPRTRFPEFETAILWPNCGGTDAYKAVLDTLDEVREDANSEDDMAQEVTDTIRERLRNNGIENPERTAVFIQTSVLMEWLGDLLPPQDRRSIVQVVRNLGKNGLAPAIDPSVKRWPHHGPYRCSGVAWRPENSLQILFNIMPDGSPRKAKKVTV